MSETSGQWFKGCAFGCGGLAVLIVLGIIGMSVSMRTAFDDAHIDRIILEEQFGDHDGFTPAVDGAVPADRVSAFLAVRDALAGIHADVEGVDQEMGEFETIVDEDEPELGVTLPAVFRLTKSMMGLPWIFGEIERTRNRALVEAGMGLGEYTYIYVTAYHERMVSPDTRSNLFSASAANNRVRDNLRGMIERQLEAAKVALGEDDESVVALAAELERLEADHRRIPWQDGLPVQVAASFTADRDHLDATYSAAAAEFDLLNSTIRGGGLSIEMK